MSVCLSVCQTTTNESLDVGSSYLHIRCISSEYRSGSYMKVIWSRSRSQEQKRSTTIQYSRNGNMRTSINPDPHSVKIPSPITQRLYITHRVVNIWNSLPFEVITVTSVNRFKNRLDLFWADQKVLYNYKANITGNRGIKL